MAACAGVFVVVLAGTGSILEFEPELDRAFHARLSYVRSEKAPLSLVEIGSAVSRKFGGEPVVAYFLSTAPDFSWRVALPSGIAYVNQYTGEVLGERRREETFLGFIRELHLRLGGGELGGGVLKWSTVAMLFSLVSGLYLWWPKKQIRIRVTRGRRRWSDLHNSVGIVSLLPLALLAATGVMLGFQRQLAPVVYRVTASHPITVSRSLVSVDQAGAITITPDQAVAIARGLVPNAVPYRVQMPRYGGTYQVALADANGGGVADDRNVVALDPYGNIVSVMKSSALSRGDRVFMVNEAIHTGGIFGIPTRVGAFLATIAAIMQVLSGLAMWMYRRKSVSGVAVSLETTS